MTKLSYSKHLFRDFFVEIKFLLNRHVLLRFDGQNLSKIANINCEHPPVKTAQEYDYKKGNTTENIFSVAWLQDLQNIKLVKKCTVLLFQIRIFRCPSQPGATLGTSIFFLLFYGPFKNVWFFYQLKPFFEFYLGSYGFLKALQGSSGFFIIFQDYLGFLRVP